MLTGQTIPNWTENRATSALCASGKLGALLASGIAEGDSGNPDVGRPGEVIRNYRHGFALSNGAFAELKRR